MTLILLCYDFEVLNERASDNSVVKKQYGNYGKHLEEKKNINKGKQFFLMRWVVIFIMNFRTSSSSCHARKDLRTVEQL